MSSLTSLPTSTPTAEPVSVPSRAARWSGRVLSGLTILFLLMDVAFKFLPQSQPVIDAFVQLGYDPAIAPVLGVLLLTCTLPYIWPRTAVWGALRLTGYLGGAIATHLRVGNPLASHTLFPVYVAVFAWGGLYLRDARVRRLFALRTEV